ncbi:hypothetical protein U1Q18_033481 [Sarracenia purpurea var. burkii]
MGSQVEWNLENGGDHESKESGKEKLIGRTAQSLSSSLVRRKSDPMLVSKVRFRILRDFLGNLQEVILGTKLCLLFPAIPLAILAQCYHFGRVSVCLFFHLTCI